MLIPSKRPRIALITHNLSEGGGTATLVTFLYRVLTESGRYSPEIISLATSASDSASVRLLAPDSWFHGPLAQSRKWSGLPFRHVGSYLAEFEFQRYQPRAVLERILEKYDLLQFAVGVPPWVCVAGGLKKPVLLWTATTVWADRAARVRHATLPRRQWMQFMATIAQIYERRALQRADFVFALSEYTFDKIKRFVASERVGLAFCGVDTERFSPSKHPEGEYILCVSRLADARKNVSLLLQAYADLAGRSVSLPYLYIVGGQPPNSILQWVSELGIADRVRILGTQDERELADLYRNAQFFVLPSDEEGLGIVILEAMASGLPVVSTRCGGPETIVLDGETGLLTPVGDAQALADAMTQLIEDPGLRQRMGEAGRQHAVERFSLGVTGKVFLDRYEDLLGE